LYVLGALLRRSTQTGRVYALEKIDLTGDFARPMDPQPSTPTPDGRQHVFVGGPSWIWNVARRSTDGRIHDRTITVTNCGRICIGRRKINLSTVFAGQNVGIKEVSDKVWLVSFMQYDLGFFDQETGRITSAENPFGAKVTHVPGMNRYRCAR
jgi:hypothetical protein